MCISAGAVAYAEGGSFKVDWRTFSREMGFYFISLFAFIYCVTGNVSTSLGNSFDPDTWNHCLNITFGRSMLLVCGQIVYIVFSAYTETIIAFFEGPDKASISVELGGVTGNPMNPNAAPVAEPSRPKAPLAPVADKDIEWRKSDWDEIKMGDERGSIAADFLPQQWKPRPSKLGPDPNRPSVAGDKPGDVAVEPSRRSSMHVHDENHVWVVPEETIWKVWYYMMLPLNLAFFYTIPDVRNDKRKDDFFQNIAVSVSWIAILAYVLCECLQEFGVLFGIPSVVMGLTFSAVGTSFPNLYASMIVAREGKGEMALSNALGSNVFNIFVALGLPWALWTAIFGKDYNDLQNGGIVYLTLVLMLICVIYYVAIALNGFALSSWMTPFFIGAYLTVVVVGCLQDEFE
jgi:Ca2+/Na+ antiporter